MHSLSLPLFFCPRASCHMTGNLLESWGLVCSFGNTAISSVFCYLVFSRCQEVLGWLLVQPALLLTCQPNIYLSPRSISGCEVLYLFLFKKSLTRLGKVSDFKKFVSCVFLVQWHGEAGTVRVKPFYLKTFAPSTCRWFSIPTSFPLVWQLVL